MTPESMTLRAAPRNSCAPELAFPPGFLRGQARCMDALYRKLAAVAVSDLPILVLGETGVGKEGIARLIHESSPRRRSPLVAVNCAAIPPELAEAELFGIDEGVATGVHGRPGSFREASGGTLFLDEVGAMPLALQAKLLRVLQNKEVRPVGGLARPVDVRLVAATNGDFARQVERGEVRRDLFYRLAGMVVEVPPLRERREDVPALAEHFARLAAKSTKSAPRALTPGALAALRERPWPGNVRQLEHAVSLLVHVCPEDRPITAGLVADVLGAAEPASADALDFRRLACLDLARLEREAVKEALARTGGNQSRAAPLLGITRESLRRRIERHGL